MVEQNYPETITYLGIRLTVQCDDPVDPFYHPQDFFPVAKEGGVYIGRSAGSDVQLSNTSVSSVHCRVEMVHGGYYLEDAGSSNGTFVGYHRLEPGERYALRDGDVIGVMNYNITFRLGLSAFGPAGGEAGLLDLENTFQVGQAMVESFLDEPEEHSPKIQILDGPQAGETYTLQQYDDVLIGRDSMCYICLPGDSAVSRQHAMLRRDWSGVTIRDLNSSNGVCINRVRIQPNTEVEINDGDQISIGHFVLFFHDPFAASLEDKLKGVWLGEDDDATYQGLAPLEGQGGEKGGGPLQEMGEQAEGVRDLEIDTREPQSGQWRVRKSEPAKAEEEGGRRKRRRSRRSQRNRKEEEGEQVSLEGEVGGENDLVEDPKERRRRRRKERLERERRQKEAAAEANVGSPEPVSSEAGIEAQEERQASTQGGAEKGRAKRGENASKPSKSAEGAREDRAKERGSERKASASASSKESQQGARARGAETKGRPDGAGQSPKTNRIRPREAEESGRGGQEVQLGRWERYGLIAAIVLIFILVILVLVQLFLV